MTLNWTTQEVEAAVANYFRMLRLELAGKKYNKSAHRRELKELLNNRTDGSIELKHQNISAVLIEMGIPYIDGYKPRRNYQRNLLPEVVADYLKNNPEIKAALEADSTASLAVPTVKDILAVMEEPPTPEEKPGLAAKESAPIYNPVGINYIEREAQNQATGELGEQLVINFERARLIHIGKEALADRIEQVSSTIGPVAGYDIRSFEEDGTDRFIEAKATKYGKNTPFFITPNELKFSEQNASRYYLYRVFRLRSEPKLFALQGHLQDTCTLAPSQYMGRVK